MTTVPLLLLPGDGIGKETMAEVRKFITAMNEKFGAGFETDEGLVGGSAYDAHGKAISEEDMAKAMAAEGISVTNTTCSKALEKFRQGNVTEAPAPTPTARHHGGVHRHGGSGGGPDIIPQIRELALQVGGINELKRWVDNLADFDF